MSDIAIIVAESEGALDALANASNLQIIDGTRQPYSSLTTYTTPARRGVREIDTADGGWIAFATS